MFFYGYKNWSNIINRVLKHYFVCFYVIEFFFEVASYQFLKHGRSFPKYGFFQGKHSKISEFSSNIEREMGIIVGHPTVIGHFIYLDEKSG